MNHPLVSVIIPTYNREKYIARAIDSVKKQIYENIEIIVINDGSTDNTKEVLKKYKDDITLLYHRTNKGSSFARNKGLKKAQGDYIAFLDSDDYWTANKVGSQVSHLHNNPDILVCHTNWNIMVNDKISQPKIKEYNDGYIFNTMLQYCAMLPSTTMIHKDVIKNIGYINTKFVLGDIYHYLIKITSKYNVIYDHRKMAVKEDFTDNQLSKKLSPVDRGLLVLNDLKDNSLFTQEQKTLIHRRIEELNKIKSRTR